MITDYGKNFNFNSLMAKLKRVFATYNVPIVTLMATQEDNPFKILISTILSARTKDGVTAESSKRLYKVADTPEKLVKLPLDQIEKLIYPVGFYKVKAQRIKSAADKIISEYSGNVPNKMEELLKFDGVGRKTANLVLGEAFNKQAICVDIHVHRISNRLGIIETQTPLDTEMDLQGILPKKHWIRYNTFLVAHGQQICKPISPMCSKCEIKEFCQKRNVTKSR